MFMKTFQLTLLFAILLVSGGVNAQREYKYVYFFLDSNFQAGFDSPGQTYFDHYEKFFTPDSVQYKVPFISIEKNKPAQILFGWDHLSHPNRSEVEFTVGDTLVQFSDTLQTLEDTLTLFLPPSDTSYAIHATLDGQLIGKLNVEVYEPMSEELIIVPLVDWQLDRDSLQSYINRIYGQAFLHFEISVSERVKLEEYDKPLLNNPSPQHDRYTRQMIEIRDAYFDQFPEATRSAYYLFLVEGFVNEREQGYMVKNKGFGFIKVSEEQMYETIAQQLGFGVGAMVGAVDENTERKDGLSGNLMELSSGGTNLTRFQWESIRHNCHTISFYDDYEDVRTRGGLIAFYFWKENEKGEIVWKNNKLLSSIKRPMKRNQFSYHLNITNFFFQPLFQIAKYRINVLHFFGLMVLIVLLVVVRKRINKWLRKFSRLTRILVRSFAFLLFLVSCYEVFVVINMGYGMFMVKSGNVPEMEGMSIRGAMNTIFANHENPKLEEDKMASQLMVKRGEDWVLLRRKRILYFNCTDEGGKQILKYSHDSDTLKLSKLNHVQFVNGHYFVINYRNASGELLEQKVYNHTGTDITNKLTLPDPARRILLFVNGYRPTSSGQTLEENFDDITKNGLEYANSINLIYDFDRYDYWRPWKEIDLLFTARINPEETFYADGHFSVETSNHRSLLNFTTLSTSYPERCKNPKKHVCKTQEQRSIFGTRTTKTIEMFNLKPNVKGFNERKRNGRIAGKNLAQMLGEIPNRSQNDTLYVVAHSMGFAYAQGIIEELRGKINFGSFYIIAPENASAGKIQLDEWQEVWQYGSNFEKDRLNAPCLTDGIAPQVAVSGLSLAERVFIPEMYYRKRGFFDSHFIGYYTWIFDITKGKKGYIRQR